MHPCSNNHRTPSSSSPRLPYTISTSSLHCPNTISTWLYHPVMSFRSWRPERNRARVKRRMKQWGACFTTMWPPLFHLHLADFWLLGVSMRPYYLPREFSHAVVVVAVVVVMCMYHICTWFKADRHGQQCQANKIHSNNYKIALGKENPWTSIQVKAQSNECERSALSGGIGCLLMCMCMWFGE